VAGHLRALRHRPAPVTERASTLRDRALEVLMWGAVVLVGGYLLLPAAVDLVRTRQQEDRERLRAEEAEAGLRTAQERLEQVGNDPQAIDKIRESQQLEARRGERHE
jgi:hypothetical protein